MKRSLVSVLSWLLVIAMLASVMPMAAFADAGTHEHYDASTANGLSSHMKEVTDLTVEGTCKNGESKTSSLRAPSKEPKENSFRPLVRINGIS